MLSAQYTLDITFILYSWAGTAFVRYRVQEGSLAQSEATNKNWNGKISLDGGASKSWDWGHLKVRLELLGILQILCLWCGQWQKGRRQKAGWRHRLTQAGWQNEETTVKKQRWEMPGDNHSPPWSNVCHLSSVDAFWRTGWEVPHGRRHPEPQTYIIVLQFFNSTAKISVDNTEVLSWAVKN